MVSWVDAVKQYATDSGKKFSIPKKDSDDYKAIKALQQKMSESEMKGLVKEKKEKVERVIVAEPVAPAPEIKAEPLTKKKTPKPVAPVKSEPAPQELKPKKRVPKVRTVAEPVAVEAPPQEPDVPLVVSRKTKKQIKAEKVVPDAPAPSPAPAPAPDVPLVVVRKSRKEKAVEKKAVQSAESERNAILSAKKALDDYKKMKFVDQQVIFSFD